MPLSVAPKAEKGLRRVVPGPTLDRIEETLAGIDDVALIRDGLAMTAQADGCPVVRTTLPLRHATTDPDQGPEFAEASPAKIYVGDVLSLTSRCLGYTVVSSLESISWCDLDTGIGIRFQAPPRMHAAVMAGLKIQNGQRQVSDLLVRHTDIGQYWWVEMFRLPALFAKQPSESRRSYVPWYWAGLTSFLIAYAIWTTGVNDHHLCDPDSLIQAHAVWRLLTAFATWCFFMFLRTERPRVKDSPADPASVVS